MYWDEILEELIQKPREERNSFYDKNVIESIGSLSHSLGYSSKPVYLDSGAFSKVYQISKEKVLIVNKNKKDFEANKLARELLPHFKIPKIYEILEVENGQIGIVELIKGKPIWWSTPQTLINNIDEISNKITTIEKKSFEGWGKIDSNTKHGLNDSLLEAVQDSPISCTCEGFFCEKMLPTLDMKKAVEQIENYDWNWLKTQKNITHGDYHLGNILALEGEITGIVDWSYLSLMPSLYDCMDIERNIPFCPIDSKPIVDKVMNYYGELCSMEEALEALRICMLVNRIGRLALFSHRGKEILKKEFLHLQHILEKPYTRWSKEHTPSHL